MSLSIRSITSICFTTTFRRLSVCWSATAFCLFDAYLAPIHGGSIVGFVTHTGRAEQSARLLEMKRLEAEERSNEIETTTRSIGRIPADEDGELDYLSAAKRAGKRVFGFGCSGEGQYDAELFRAWARTT